MASVLIESYKANSQEMKVRLRLNADPGDVGALLHIAMRMNTDFRISMLNAAADYLLEHPEIDFSRIQQFLKEKKRPGCT